MHFTPGIWRHRRNTDLDIKIVQVVEQSTDHVKVTAFYVRRDFGWGEILLYPKPDTLTIIRKEWENWTRVG